jgi:hypothetical protein
MSRIPPLPSVDALQVLGHGLGRPGCVACTRAGALRVRHAPPGAGGGVARFDGDGRPHPIGAGDGAPADLIPDGWGREPGCAGLPANLEDRGGVSRRAPDGSCSPALREPQGVAVPPESAF